MATTTLAEFGTTDRVRYHGTLEAAHGVYKQGSVCSCEWCHQEDMRARNEDRAPDTHWLLVRADAAVLHHVHPSHFTHEPHVA